MCECAGSEGTRFGRGSGRKHTEGLEIGNGNVVGEYDVGHEGD